MSVKSVVILLVLVLLAGSAGLIAYVRYYDALERSRRISELLDEGFLAVNSDPDTAVAKALEVLESDPDRSAAYLLQGRANFLKGRYRAALDLFETGLDRLEDLSLQPEYKFHAGMACLNLFRESHDREMWREAHRYLLDVTRLGEHDWEAHYAVGLLYADPDYWNKEQVIEHWEAAIRMEEGMSGYRGAGEDGACPICRMEFRPKREEYGRQLEIVRKVAR